MGHEALSPISLHSSFKESFFGKKTAKITRWLHFKPENMKNDQWEKLLGADMNDISHMQLMYGMTRFFIEYCEHPIPSWDGAGISPDARFTPDEKRTLEVLAITHDWPEAIVGDIRYGEKNGRDGEEEADILFSMASSVFPVFLFGANRERDAVAEASNYLNNEKTKIGRAFRVVEHLGYLRTCLRARQKAKEMAKGEDTSGEDLDLLNNLTEMGTVTAQEEINWLKKNGAEYPAVARFFEVWGINVDKV